MRKALILSLLAGIAFAGSAHADQAGWCAAYARDFADARATDKVLWQHKYDIAQKDCLEKEAQSSPVVETKKAETTTATSSQKVAAATPAKDVAPEPAAPVKKDVASGPPVEGTPEWNAYCSKKYSSFESKTGMYLSHTGVQRKCIYTG
jgi:hypothetical protein